MIASSPICVVGNLNIDLVLRNVPGFPVWGQEVFGTAHSQFSSGQAGYLAFALSHLGVPVSLIANVGEDRYGQQIVDDLNASGVITSGVEVTPGGQTGITIALVRADGERAFISDIGCLRDFSEEMIVRGQALIEDSAIVCLVGLFCLPGLSYEAAARSLGNARRAGKITMLDTGWDPLGWPETTRDGMRLLLSEVSLFLPNMDEARAITGEEKAEEAVRALRALGPEMVVIKCGDQGSYALCGSEACQVRARRVKVLDTVGAGDVFNAGFLYGLSQHRPLYDCLAYGNSAASLYISRSADRFPTLLNVEQAASELLSPEGRKP